ncbi:MAG: tol-pal system-associated acyl-CoA thioesterase [Thiomonas sp.]|uniref:tol-pal system-associated acyl-CoA thioesterase n=1 Tax=Thiomonas sp. TaxID=2047785 RepID=UPI002A369DC0|nr:tol-pal system-associated acyl-CoA thioesterase [Thiomonas sp.]MDY0329594.1 tol-pal system-associated acyl-CoA thioesterase [Thiomonas sp.]
MKADATVFHWPVRVYWEDTDAGGIVYHANYLKFFERARTEWLRSLGLEQSELAAQAGLAFVVAEMHLRYSAPAKLDDALQVRLRLQDIGSASLTVAQQAWRCDERGALAALLCEATVRVGCVAASTLRPSRMPKDVHERVTQWAAALGACRT